MTGILRFAMTTAPATDAAVDPIGALLQLVLPFGLMFGVMWFIIIRPQRKKEKALRAQINAMVKGDEVVTAGGIVGKVENIKDDEITISTSINRTLVTVRRSAISTVIKPISD